MRVEISKQFVQSVPWFGLLVLEFLSFFAHDNNKSAIKMEITELFVQAPASTAIDEHNPSSSIDLSLMPLLREILKNCPASTAKRKAFITIIVLAAAAAAHSFASVVL
jgi:hypothetical protein